MLQASNDHQVRVSLTATGEVDINCSNGILLSKKYWAQRLFAFLSKLSELKSVPKGEKHLFNFADFV